MPSSATVRTVQLSFAAAFGALVLGGAIMGISPIFVRTAETSSFVSAFWRVVFALPFLAIWAAIRYTVGKTAYGYKGLGDVYVLLFFGWLGVLGSFFSGGD